MITLQTILLLGFKEIGNAFGAAHYRNGDVEIRHTQANGKWWLTDGRQSFDILCQLKTKDEVCSLIKNQSDYDTQNRTT